MKIHKITLFMYDINNDSSLEDCKTEIENGVSNYFQLDFSKCESKEAGEWHDNHKLNNIKTNVDDYFKKLK